MGNEGEISVDLFILFSGCAACNQRREQCSRKYVLFSPYTTWQRSSFCTKRIIFFSQFAQGLQQTSSVRVIQQCSFVKISSFSTLLCYLFCAIFIYCLSNSVAVTVMVSREADKYKMSSN